MPAAPSVGTLSKIGFGTSATMTSAFEYKNWTIGKRGLVLDTAGIRGTRSHPKERTRNGCYTIGGNFSFDPGSADITLWLPYILGTSGALTETVASFYLGIDRIAGGMTYNSCKVDRATFSSQQGDFLTLSMDIEALTETAGTVTGLSALTPSLAVPYVLMDATLSIASTSYQFRQASVTVNNNLKKDRFMNSVSRTDLPELDRSVEVALSLPYTSDTAALYDTGATSAAVVLTFNNGVTSFVMTMAAVQFPAIPPETPGRDEILLPLIGVARKTGSTLELVCTNS